MPVMGIFEKFREGIVAPTSATILAAAVSGCGSKIEDVQKSERTEVREKITNIQPESRGGYRSVTPSQVDVDDSSAQKDPLGELLGAKQSMLNSLKGRIPDEEYRDLEQKFLELEKGVEETKKKKQ